jgi:hypothetical protein
MTPPSRRAGRRLSHAVRLVAAVTTLPPEWMAPEYLQSLVGQATAVRVALGESPTVSIRAR